MSGASFWINCGHPDVLASHHGQLCAFIEGNEAVIFHPQDRDGVYTFIRETLVRFGYVTLGKRYKGVVLKLLVVATGHSRQQTERLVRQWRKTGAIRDRRGGSRGRPFARQFSGADIRLLAEVDEAFEQMSGLATRAILRRQYEVFGDPRFERLATISNGHIYNLRAPSTNCAKRTVWTKTRALTVSIGLRQTPQPDGQPGHVRVDTLHAWTAFSWRLGRRQGRVSDQSDGRCVPVRVRRYGSGYLGALPGPAARGVVVVLSVANSRLPRRLRRRIHQPPGRCAS